MSIVTMVLVMDLEQVQIGSTMVLTTMAIMAMFGITMAAMGQVFPTGSPVATTPAAAVLTIQTIVQPMEVGDALPASAG